MVIKGIVNILFPKYCPGCGRSLDQAKIILCLECRNALPLTHYHQQDNTRLIDKFYGILPLDQGTALLHYHKKGLAQKLIHALKYRGQKDIGLWLGNWLGLELLTIESYRQISAVVPVPMHPDKLSSRGYNQAAIFGRALARSMQIPCLEKLLIQTEMRKTQAKKGRWERWSKKQTFALNPRYAHLTSMYSASKNIDHNNVLGVPSVKILLVDDVITTGATIEACGKILMSELGASVSCASIAIA